MALAAILGCICGLVSFLPLLGATSAVRRVTKTSNLSHLSILLLAVAGSFVVLFVSTFICISVDRNDVFWFVVGEAVGLIAFAVAYGIKTFNLRKKH